MFSYWVETFPLVVNFGSCSTLSTMSIVHRLFSAPTYLVNHFLSFRFRSLCVPLPVRLANNQLDLVFNPISQPTSQNWRADHAHSHIQWPMRATCWFLESYWWFFLWELFLCWVCVCICARVCDAYPRVWMSPCEVCAQAHGAQTDAGRLPPPLSSFIYWLGSLAEPRAGYWQSSLSLSVPSLSAWLLHGSWGSTLQSWAVNLKR